MGFRSEWLSAHRWHGSRHLEPVLYGFDKEMPVDRAVALLEAGVENGGDLETWLSVLPLGSTVLGLDVDPKACENEFDVLLCDVTDASAVRSVLRGRWFDVVVDDTRAGCSEHLWPFIKPGGLLLIEGDVGRATTLIDALSSGEDSWLPGEELMRVTCYPGLFVVEKRVPRIHEYLEIAQGQRWPAVPLDELLECGVKKVVE